MPPLKERRPNQSLQPTAPKRPWLISNVGQKMKIFDWLFGRRERALENVSPYAQQMLVLARQEADRLFHSFVGTEHLLLALLSTSDGAVALKTAGIDPVQLKKIVEEALHPGTTVRREAVIPCTPRVMQVLKIGGKEAAELGHDFLGSEHIVLGLLRLRKGVAWQSMKKFPVSLERARSEIRSRLFVSSQMPNQASEPTAPSGRGSP